MKRYVVALTGASGAPYFLRLVKELLEKENEVHLLVTNAGFRVLNEEHDFVIKKKAEFFYELYHLKKDRLYYHNINDIGASIASGSFLIDAMVVVPCTMGTLAKIACGFSSNLLERTADVVIKERRKLILVPRETPFSSLHLENMLKLSRLGVIIFPPIPAFYYRPQKLDDHTAFIVGKILDLLGVENRLYKRWQE